MIRESIPGKELLHKAHTIGQYYGFAPLTTLAMRPRNADASSKDNQLIVPADASGDPLIEIISNFLKQCRQVERIPTLRQPLFVWHSNIAFGRSAQKKAFLQFHAIGTDRAIADAVVIRALLALVKDLFREEPTLRINSMGDRETRARYTRELGVFFKKRASILPEECLLLAKTDVFRAAESAISHGFTEDLPSPMEHLSDASRKRFEDLLEYLETTETSYELSRHLFGKSTAWNEVCFEIVVGERRVVWGSRYGDITRHLFSPSVLPAIGAIFSAISEGSVVKQTPHPRLRFSFVHIGDEAKRFSIRLAEEFRRAHVPITQHIGIESLTEQIHLAERQNSPYLLIMGRKEALENTAILRNRRTQEETVLPLAGLLDRLKTFV